MRLLVILILFCGYIPPAFAACEDWLSGKTGNLISEAHDARIYFLGAGDRADVFRVVKTDGPTEIQKVYLTAGNLEDELLGMEFLREAVEELGLQNELKIAKVLRIDAQAKTVYFEDAVGETLGDVVEKNLVSDERVALLTGKYIGARERIEAYIEAKWHKCLMLNHRTLGASPIHNIRAMMIRRGGPYFGIALKLDNILVLRDGGLLLFDPA